MLFSQAPLIIPSVESAGVMKWSLPVSRCNLCRHQPHWASRGVLSCADTLRHQMIFTQYFPCIMYLFTELKHNPLTHAEPDMNLARLDDCSLVTLTWLLTPPLRGHSAPWYGLGGGGGRGNYPRWWSGRDIYLKWFALPVEIYGTWLGEHTGSGLTPAIMKFSLKMILQYGY